MKRMKRVAVAALFIMVSAGLLAWDTESVHSNAPARAETDTLGIDTLFIHAKNFIVHTPDDDRDAALQCLALNVYWEARSEPMQGQLAVAAVTLNRVNDQRFPDDVCDVVRQGGEVRKHRCQFSWWCDGKKDIPKEADAWRRALTIARLTYAGVVSDPTDGALWYHADYVNPDWASYKTIAAKIGRHIFYVYPARSLEVSSLSPSDLKR